MSINITPQQAYRHVSVYVGNQITDLLPREMPQLVVYTDGTYWRVPMVLPSKSHGCIGVVRVIDVDAEPGDLPIHNSAAGTDGEQCTSHF